MSTHYVPGTTMYRWAFPRDAHHQLLLAAIGSAAVAGREAAREWLTEHDIDDASFRDQRLLLAVIGRFGNELAQHQAYPRLLGLQKLLWCRSLLSLQEAKPTMQRLATAGHPLLVIKGASRLASQAAARKLRVAWDIDIVVRPESMRPVFDTLIADRWQASSGASHHYVRNNLQAIRSLNFYKGNYGDIDLHSQPFHPGQGGSDDDRMLWERSVATMLGNVPVQTPCAEDRIALAIAHGGLDGHVHSDWLVDCAAILQTDDLDWDLLRKIILTRGLQVPANVMFRYFSEKLKLDIPHSFLDQLSRAPLTEPIKTLMGLIQARPKEQSGCVGQIIRLLAKKYRKRASARFLAARPTEHRLSTLHMKAPDTEVSDEFVKSFELPYLPYGQSGDTVEVELVVDMEPFVGRRRVELEINSPDSHVCRIRYRRVVGINGPVRLKAFGRLSSLEPASRLTLVSRPSRQLRSQATLRQRQAYDSLRFRVVSWQANTTPQRRG